MNYRLLIITALWIGSLSLISCDNTQKELAEQLTEQKTAESNSSIDTDKLIGSWEDQSESALHFTLYADGTAQSDNMKTLVYQTWSTENDSLYLVFKSIGNKITSIDTVVYNIQELDDKKLVLERDNLATTYKKVNTMNDSAQSKNNPLKTLKGQLVWGHEARTFTPCGSDKTFWILDETEKLKGIYNELTQEEESYSSIFAEIEVQDKGITEEGFPANYDGVYEVIRVIEARKLDDNDCE